MNGLNYLLQSNLYLIVFFGFYWVLLRKETFNNFNRAYLIIASVASFAIPLWNLQMIQSWMVTKKATEVACGIDFSSIITNSTHNQNNISVTDYLFYFYMAGCVLVAIKLFTNIFNLYSYIAQNESLNKAFTFLNTIFIEPAADPDDVIFNHERVHASHYHSVDVLMFEVIGIFCWFNPIIYAYKASIKNIHEFIADEIASKNIGKVDYAMLLFSECFQTHPSVLVSNFFTKTSLKTRIEMLNKKRSNKVAILKYGLIAPLFLGMLVFTSVAIAKGKEISELLLMGVKINATGTVNDFSGKPIQGAIIVEMGKTNGTTTDADGKFTLQVSKNDASLAFSHVSFQTKFITINGNQDFVISLKRQTNELDGVFVLSTKTSEATTITQAEEVVEVENNSDYKIVEQMAEFKGGISGLQKYLKANLKYPQEAKTNKKQGIVYMKFNIATNGSVYNILSASPLGYIGYLGDGLEEEAKRVVAAMPNWKPAMQNGIPQISEYSLPIQFILDGEVAKKDSAITIKGVPKDALYELKGESATKKYGEKASKGVVENFAKSDTKQTPNDDEVFTQVEQQAEFFGGYSALAKFLESNLKYPLEAQKAKIQGKVFVSFVVTKSGAISDVNILKGLGYGLNEEAVRVIKAMPKWKPAMQSGKIVNSKFNLPIAFVLRNK